MERESEGISMNNLVETDYMVVQSRTLPVIASEIHQIERTVYGVALDGAIQIGRKLQEAKAMIPSGEWVKWLDENLNYSQRQAYNFMEIADNYGDENSPFYNLQTSANVSISNALSQIRIIFLGYFSDFPALYPTIAPTSKAVKTHSTKSAFPFLAVTNATMFSKSSM